ncbi:MAG: restriction endonuclease subunit S [Pirellulales bacterium]|nr:restriction endonuclease subunit S [Pirellulales bacterium]
MSSGDGLPKGWASTTLGKCLPIEYGKGLTKRDRDSSGTIPVYGSNGVVGTHSTKLTSGVTLIIGRKGSAGAVHYSPGPCWAIDTTYYTQGTPYTNLQYFYYLLVHTQLGSLDRSTAVPSLSRDDYNATVVPVAPLAEQHRIVEKLEELLTDLDAGMAALERVRGNLKRYRASVLKAAVEGRLTAAWRAENPPKEPARQLLARILKERRRRWEEQQLAAYKAKSKTPPKGWEKKYKEPAEPDTTNLPELPEGWCWARVDQVGDVQLGRQRSPKHHQGPHMRPYLRVANVFEDRIDTSDVMEMNFTPVEYETYRLDYGDILLNEGQSKELVGRPAIYRNEVPGSCFTNTLVRFKARSGIDPEYALAVFLTYLKNGRFQKIASITVNIAHLGAGRFAEVEFPVPPIDEQKQIVIELQERQTMISAIEALLDANIKRATRLRQSILKRAFEGKLVPQDPSDEPASKLLERIKQARQKAENNGKPKNKTRRKRRTA